jgi:hypothetical protein
MREPSPDKIINDLIMHAAPFTPALIEVWRLLMDGLISAFERMQRDDIQLVTRAPKPIDCPREWSAFKNEAGKTDMNLNRALETAQAMPKSFWPPRRARRTDAIEKAGNELKAWKGDGERRFLDSCEHRLNNKVRRRNREITAFEEKPDIIAAHRRLDDYSGAVRMCEGLAELEPDKELYSAIMSKSVGPPYRLNAIGGLELLRKRVAIAAALRGGRAVGAGAGKPVVEPVPDEPELDHGDGDGGEDRDEIANMLRM